MTFTIRSRGGQLRHMPERLIDGNTSAIDIELIIDPPSKNYNLWDPQPMLGPYFIPPFQRPLVWTTAQQTAFLESAYLGITLGAIIVADALNLDMQPNGRFAKTDRWLLDGQQRVNALINFSKDAFPVFVGTECEHRYSDLTTVEKRRFHSIQIGIIRVTSGSIEFCREIYDRLNFGGTPHTEDQRALI